MHPMFVKLFLETDDDDLVAEEQPRQRARKLLRNRPALAVRATGSAQGSLRPGEPLPPQPEPHTHTAPGCRADMT